MALDNIRLHYLLDDEISELAKIYDHREIVTVYESYDFERELFEELSKINGFVTSERAYSYWIIFDTETDDFALAAIMNKTIWRQVERVLAKHKRKALELALERKEDAL